MRIPLDKHSSIPLYQQIAHWLRENILSGRLPVETKLPSSRALAEELGVSRITVKNAYVVLENDGLVLTREGSGTFIAQPVTSQVLMGGNKDRNWPFWQLEATGEMAPREDTPRPRIRPSNLISFTGVGDPRHFPQKEFAQTLQAVLRRDGVSALEYGDFDEGYPPLRETVSHVLASQGIVARPQDVLITSGSQQALALTCQILLKPGDAVLVEKPTYNLALELFRNMGLKIIGIPLDEMGMQTECLEPLLQQHHPKLIYTIPNFQNPSGACMSGTRRRQLLVLAERYNVPILEDDFVGDLRYEGRAQPAIKALDGNGQVIYVGTFSKMLMPGLRVGYLLASGPIFARLAHQKRVQDLTTTPLIQRALDVYVTVGRYQRHLRRSTRLYRARRDALLFAIKRHLPEVTVSSPQGGLFAWLKLPDGVSALGLLPRAIEAGVEFAPGTRFFPNPAEGESYLRLNFATLTEDEIAEGIQRLAKVLGE